MGLIDRLRDLLPFGGAGDDGSAGAGTDGDATGQRRCAICGTPADSDASECSLCHSTDLVPAGEATDDGGAAPGADAGGGADAVVTDARSPDATDEAAERLRDLRDGDGESPAGGGETDPDDGGG